MEVVGEEAAEEVVGVKAVVDVAGNTEEVEAGEEMVLGNWVEVVAAKEKQVVVVEYQWAMKETRDSISVQSCHSYQLDPLVWDFLQQNNSTGNHLFGFQERRPFQVQHLHSLDWHLSHHLNY